MKMSVKTEDYVPRSEQMSQENKWLRKTRHEIHTIHRDMEELKHLIEYISPSKGGYWKLLK